METSFPREKMKLVLIEKIHPAARARLQEGGYTVLQHEAALEGAALIDAIKDAHVIGVRSRTKLRRDILKAAPRLLASGCFSVGTDQVDLEAATEIAVPVFNAPHSSTRSVAELAIGNVIMLARRAADKSQKLHQGVWDKNIAGAVEVRGKTLGIVGYGHIGQQAGLLGEAIGMQVLFFDVQKKLPLGNAKPVPSLEFLLENSNFVSLHVPGTAKTNRMIGAAQLEQMRHGSILLNLARGEVVDLTALRSAIERGHIAGAALDVYPEEPTPTVAEVKLELAGLPNVILTPHIGGNTEEAQRNIGGEVAESILAYIENGSTEGAVNFPCVNLPTFPGAHRILNIHKNVPGALAEINRIVSEVGANIDSQYLSTFGQLGYLIMDLNKEVSNEVKTRIERSPVNLRTRVLY